MKNLLPILIALLPSTTPAEKNICDDIVVRRSSSDQISYSTPSVVRSLYISKTVQKGQPARLYLSVTIMNAKSNKDRKALGLFIKLKDGTTAGNPLAKLDCSYVPNLILPGGEFRYSGHIIVDSEMMRKLVKSPIARLGIWDMEEEISKTDGERIRSYLSCLNGK